MTALYNLIINDKELSAEFNIGFFSELEAAEKTATEYITSVRGFCEYDCGYRITEKFVIDFTDEAAPQKIYIVYGWNENKHSDEAVIESECYSSETAARQKLIELSSRVRRTEWTVDCYTVNERKWQDGFVRV